MRTRGEISSMIARLKKEKETLPVINFFGENNHEKIEVQICVLENLMSEADVYNAVDEGDIDKDYESDAVVAAQWISKEVDDDELI